MQRFQKSIFAQNLITQRKTLGWSQGEAAKRLNTHVRNLRNYEYGYLEPNIKTMKKIIEVYGIDDFYLFLSKQLLQNVV